MDFNDTPEEAAWRKEVRDFLDKEYPDEFRGRGARRGPSTSDGGEDTGEGLFRDASKKSTPLDRWRSALATRGWVAPAWPRSTAARALTRRSSSF